MRMTILGVLASSLGNKECDLEVDLWDEFLEELANQAVIALPYDYVVKNIPNASLLNNYRNTVLFNVANYLRLLATQQHVLNNLSENSINAVVLKGTSAAKYYPKPEYRMMGDIDILVNPQEFDKANAVMLELGYKPIIEVESYRRHIAYLNVQGIEIELHQYFSFVGTEKQRNYLDESLYRGLENANNFMLPELENGLVLIGHIAQHLSSGLGLRQIIDWMMYVNANMTDQFWEISFSDPARKCGFYKLAKVSTKLCKKYLGLDMSITWCDDVDDEVVDSLMLYIMEQGNFGRKQVLNERDTTTIMNNLRSPKSFFKYLQAGGKSHWKLARTNKFFGIFAWAYQIIHLIRMGLTRKIGFKSIYNSKIASSKIITLLDELDIEEYGH